MCNYGKRTEKRRFVFRQICSRTTKKFETKESLWFRIAVSLSIERSVFLFSFPFFRSIENSADLVDRDDPERVRIIFFFSFLFFFFPQFDSIKSLRKIERTRPRREANTVRHLLRPLLLFFSSISILNIREKFYVSRAFACRLRNYEVGAIKRYRV